jgi:hypothetical protein
MEYEIEWEDVMEYLEKHSISLSEKDSVLDAINYDIDDIIEYLENHDISDSDTNEILEAVDHTCKEIVEEEPYGLKLPTENLNDECRFDIVRNLYNNLTLEELQDIENKIKIRII